MKFVLIYFVIMNLIGFFIMGIDKKKAIRKAYRIPEKILFLSSLLGGSIGTWAGMYVFHHKTKHWYFVWGMPFILLVQVVIGWILYTEGILAPPFH